MYNAYIACNKTWNLGGRGGGSVSLFFLLAFDEEKNKFWSELSRKSYVRNKSFKRSEEI